MPKPVRTAIPYPFDHTGPSCKRETPERCRIADENRQVHLSLGRVLRPASDIGQAHQTPDSHAGFSQCSQGLHGIFSLLRTGTSDDLSTRDLPAVHQRRRNRTVRQSGAAISGQEDIVGFRDSRNHQAARSASNRNTHSVAGHGRTSGIRWTSSGNSRRTRFWSSLFRIGTPSRTRGSWKTPGTHFRVVLRSGALLSSRQRDEPTEVGFRLA